MKFANILRSGGQVASNRFLKIGGQKNIALLNSYVHGFGGDAKSSLKFQSRDEVESHVQLLFMQNDGTSYEHQNNKSLKAWQWIKIPRYVDQIIILYGPFWPGSVWKLKIVGQK